MFGDDGIAIVSRVIPNGCNCGIVEGDARNVFTARLEIGWALHQSRRQVLIKEQLHRCATSVWRSRSAA